MLTQNSDINYLNIVGGWAEMFVWIFIIGFKTAIVDDHMCLVIVDNNRILISKNNLTIVLIFGLNLIFIVVHNTQK